MIDAGHRDRHGRRISLHTIGDDWRAVADVVPRDDQRDFVFPSAARYVLLSVLEGEWRSLGIRAGDAVVGHVMWAVDDDGSRWIGGLVIDRSHQGAGIGRAATEALVAWLFDQPDCAVVRLSYAPGNTAAAALYASLGFTPTGDREDGEVVVERVAPIDVPKAAP
jgi:diamine N-acetyltransferase